MAIWLSALANHGVIIEIAGISAGVAGVSIMKISMGEEMAAI